MRKKKTDSLLCIWFSSSLSHSGEPYSTVTRLHTCCWASCPISSTNFKLVWVYNNGRGFGGGITLVMMSDLRIVVIIFFSRYTIAQDCQCIRSRAVSYTHESEREDSSHLSRVNSRRPCLHEHHKGGESSDQD